MAEIETIDTVLSLETTGTCEVVIPQIGSYLTVYTKDGQYRLTPQQSMTGYQAVRIAAMIAIIGSQGRGWCAIDDLFASVYAETTEHWTKLDEVKV